MKIYIVEAQFSSGDSCYDYIIGIFDNAKLADYQKEKWHRFFTEKYKEIFTPFLSLIDKDDYFSEEVESEYYKKQSEYRLIFEYESINIREWSLNSDWFSSELSLLNTESGTLIDSMKEYSLKNDREMKLNKIFEDG